MSAVTAAILIGSTPRYGSGIIPRWIALLHEGRSYAWHLLRLQLSVGELGDNSRDDPPGVLWRASASEDIAGELALLLHMYAARTPEIIQLTRRMRNLQRRRVDLSGLQGVERVGLENAIRVARSRGRELRLSAQIMPGSRLTDQHLLSLPDWELEVARSTFSRDWSHADGGRLVITDYSTDDASDYVDLATLHHHDDHDDEFLDDSDLHAVADHPGNLVSSFTDPGMPDLSDELLGVADAQSGLARMAAESASPTLTNGAAEPVSGGAAAAAHLGVGGHASPHHGDRASLGYAPGAGSAWLERDDNHAADTRPRGLFGRLRINR